MCLNVKVDELDESPAIFFLKQLLTRIEKAQTLQFRRTPHYFNLLRLLIENYFKNCQDFISLDDQTFKMLDPANLTKGILDQLDKYKSQESKTSSVTDYTLVGLIDVAKTLLEVNKDVLSQHECAITMNMLVEKCIFNKQ